MVTDIQPGRVVTLSTTAGVYRAKSVVITAGPWANRLLAHTGLQLPLEVFKVLVSHNHVHTAAYTGTVHATLY